MLVTLPVYTIGYDYSRIGGEKPLITDEFSIDRLRMLSKADRDQMIELMSLFIGILEVLNI